MKMVYALQHVATEPMGLIGEALAARGIAAQYVRAYAGEPVPKEIGDAAALVVMGGPMGVYEQAEYPFLSDEIRLIESALTSEKPVLGVCLGSQLLAAALGAMVRKGEKKEIGWRAVTLNRAATHDGLWQAVASPFMAYHWHGDVFDLPRGAEPLASSAQTVYQAYRYGRNVYGFLFHMEATPQIITDMVEAFADELCEENIDAREILAGVGDHLPGLARIGGTVFGRWADLIERAE
jgi:GMP synthase (glutamine-hydrolysing)